VETRGPETRLGKCTDLLHTATYIYIYNYMYVYVFVYMYLYMWQNNTKLIRIPPDRWAPGHKSGHLGTRAPTCVGTRVATLGTRAGHKSGHVVQEQPRGYKRGHLDTRAATWPQERPPWYKYSHLGTREAITDHHGPSRASRPITGHCEPSRPPRPHQPGPNKLCRTYARLDFSVKF